MPATSKCGEDELAKLIVTVSPAMSTAKGTENSSMTDRKPCQITFVEMMFVHSGICSEAMFVEMTFVSNTFVQKTLVQYTFV